MAQRGGAEAASVTVAVALPRRRGRGVEVGGETAVAAATPKGRPLRVARMLAVAHELAGLLERGEVESRVEAARALGFSAARVTQLLDLTLLAPDIQEEILFLADPGAEPINERGLRSLVRHTAWPTQRRCWTKFRSPRRGSETASPLRSPSR